MFAYMTVIVLVAASFAAGLLAALAFAGFRSRRRFRASLAQLQRRLDNMRLRADKECAADLSSGIRRWMTHHVEHSIEQCRRYLDTAADVWSASHWSGQTVLRDAESIMIETEAVLDCLGRYLPSILALQRRCADELHEEILSVHGRLSMKASNGAASCDLNDERRELCAIGEDLSRCRATSADDLEAFLRQLRQHLRRMNCLAADIDRKVGLRTRSLH
jgi:hypothetical protein